MNTEQAFDQMLELLDYLTPILNDADTRDLRELMRPAKDGEEKPELSASELFGRLFPLMIGKHRSEMYGILGMLTGEPVEKVKQKPFSEIKELLKADNTILKDFFDFFPFLLQMALRA